MDSFRKLESRPHVLDTAAWVQHDRLGRITFRLVD